MKIHKETIFKITILTIIGIVIIAVLGVFSAPQAILDKKDSDTPQTAQSVTHGATESQKGQNDDTVDLDTIKKYNDAVKISEAIRNGGSGAPYGGEYINELKNLYPDLFR